MFTGAYPWKSSSTSTRWNTSAWSTPGNSRTFGGCAVTPHDPGFQRYWASPADFRLTLLVWWYRLCGSATHRGWNKCIKHWPTNYSSRIEMKNCPEHILVVTLVGCCGEKGSAESGAADTSAGKAIAERSCKAAMVWTAAARRRHSTPGGAKRALSSGVDQRVKDASALMRPEGHDRAHERCGGA